MGHMSDLQRGLTQPGPWSAEATSCGAVGAGSGVLENRCPRWPRLGGAGGDQVSSPSTPRLRQPGTCGQRLAELCGPCCLCCALCWFLFPISFAPDLLSPRAVGKLAGGGQPYCMAGGVERPLC